jgi:hypothetical protein
MRVETWVAEYERLWRTAGTDGLADLFTADATYQQHPFRELVTGLPAIREMWEAERAGPGEAFEMSSDVVAVDGDTAVVRVHVRYGPPANQEWLDMWVIRFAEDGRCRAFEEWPIAPERR